jgi:tRNA (mo5U34)-methyltransferase
MNGTSLEQQALAYNKELDTLKEPLKDQVSWYPYGTLFNFIHLKSIFNKFPLDSLIGQTKQTLDIGAADGDLAFFLETLGYHSDIIDFPPTNYNNLKGAKLLKEHLKSKINIYERDLDSQFPGLEKTYDLVFFLGILYHIKNPYYILETLSKKSKNLILSTRIAKYTPDGNLMQKNSLAYLLSPTESNNDSTNYWIFSEAGLRRIFDRTGWNVTEYVTVGDTKKSNPRDNDHDERAFVLLKSRNC